MPGMAVWRLAGFNLRKGRAMQTVDYREQMRVAYKAEYYTWQELLEVRSAHNWQEWAQHARALAVCRAAHLAEVSAEYANILEERLTDVLFTG